MGLIHSRVGPNKVSFWGLLQPILDALKLLTKSKITPLESNFLSYNFSPIFSLTFSLLLWLRVPSCAHNILYSLLFFMVLGSVLVVPVLIAGWSSNSKYSLVGSLRSVAQSISYEAVMTTLLICVCVSTITYDVLSIGVSSSLLILLLFPIWLFCTLAETHRAPFDFAESERELVSGFNTEYGGAYFAFIFLSEYRVLLVSCQVISILFLGWLIYVSFSLLTTFYVMLLSLLLLSLTIWVRVTYVRFRYDFLMITAWKSLLPISLMLIIVVLWI
jgi:NADH:ubiquinone oxidoreductase subunit H